MDETVVCRSCGAKNRLRPGETGKAPVCGRCRAPLPWLVEAGDGNFDAEIQAPVPVLVDFWAPWCGPCRMVAPVLEQLAEEYAGRLKIVKVNVDRAPATAARFRIQSIPTLTLFVGGRPAETMIGAQPKAAIVQRLARYL